MNTEDHQKGDLSVQPLVKLTAVKKPSNISNIFFVVKCDDFLFAVHWSSMGKSENNCICMTSHYIVINQLFSELDINIPSN